MKTEDYSCCLCLQNKYIFEKTEAEQKHKSCLLKSGGVRGRLSGGDKLGAPYRLSTEGLGVALYSLQNIIENSFSKYCFLW